MSTPLFHARLEWRREELEREEAGWLRKSGWSYKSQTPTCHWMWLKEWDGKTFMVDQKTASRIQAHWDAEADARAHPELYGD